MKMCYKVQYFIYARMYVCVSVTKHNLWLNKYNTHILSFSLCLSSMRKVLWKAFHFNAMQRNHGHNTLLLCIAFTIIACMCVCLFPIIFMFVFIFFYILEFFFVIFVVGICQSIDT